MQDHLWVYLPALPYPQVLVIWNSVLDKAQWPPGSECQWLFIILIIVCIEFDISDLGLSFEKSALSDPVLHSVLNWILCPDFFLFLSSFLVHPPLDFFLAWLSCQTQNALMLVLMAVWWACCVSYLLWPFPCSYTVFIKPLFSLKSAVSQLVPLFLP